MPIDYDRLTRCLQDVVRLDSSTGHERPVIERLAAEASRLGFDEIATDPNGSLIALIRGARPGRTLLLDGRCDTVGVAPGVSWAHAPFGAEIADGRVYGRGTSDMKGALVAMLYAAASQERARLAGTVAVSATVLEEVMEGAALQTVMGRVRPDFVVIGEATALNLNIGGRGRAEIVLEAIGRPAHSSTPHLGENAVLRMLPAIQAIEAMTWPSEPLLGPALMALTDIISEPYPGYSVIPSRCRVTYDRRLLVGETMDGVLSELNALPALEGVRVSVAVGEHRTYTGAMVRGVKFFPAWKLEAEHELVRRALHGLRATGLNPALGAYRFCTNAAYSAGMAGVPTVGFGPSAEGQAHVADESITLSQLRAAADGYAGLIAAVLGG